MKNIIILSSAEFAQRVVMVKAKGKPYLNCFDKKMEILLVLILVIVLSFSAVILDS